MFKKLIKKAAAVVVILLVLFSPFLLLLDFGRFIPFVLTVWLLSIVYFVFSKSRE